MYLYTPDNTYGLLAAMAPTSRLVSAGSIEPWDVALVSKAGTHHGAKLGYDQHGQVTSLC